MINLGKKIPNLVTTVSRQFYSVVAACPIVRLQFSYKQFFPPKPMDIFQNKFSGMSNEFNSRNELKNGHDGSSAHVKCTSHNAEIISFLWL